MSKQETAKQKEEPKSTDKQLSDKALSNLSELDLTLVTTSAYFKPEDSKTYVIKINPEDKVEMIKNPKFADKDGPYPNKVRVSHHAYRQQRKSTMDRKQNSL